MSTKIYDAYRLPEGADPFEIVPAVRAAILPARLRADAQSICDRAVQLADAYSLWENSGHPESVKRFGEGYRPLMPWTSAIESLQADEARRNPGSMDHDYHHFSLSLLRDPADGRLLAIAHCRATPISMAFAGFVAAQGWTDWHYQDQTDYPEEIPAGEWVERGRSWDRTLGYDAPIERGLTITVAPPFSHSTSPTVMGITEQEKEAIASCIPNDPSRRLAGMLTDHVGLALSRKTSPELGDDQPFDFGVAIRALKIVRRARHTEHAGFQALLEKVDLVELESFRRPATDHVLTHRLTTADLDELATHLVTDS